MINVAVLGYGTVGSGVYNVINDNNDVVSKRAGEEVAVKYVLDLRDFPGDPVESILVHDYSVILNDDSVDVVCEVMGGVEPAHTFVRQALEKGKHVCTSNKEMVAKHGAELIAVAKEHGVNFFFEAAVGGGIPVIRPLNDCLTADHIDEITGILNGTTNYILTRMSQEGSAFADVLKDAQDLGYAERNPDADVLGYDACRKIAILTSLVCGKQVDYEDIYTEGITEITSDDFAYAKKLGCSIKIFGRAKQIDGKFYVMVAPFMINATHCLYNVNDVYNAIFVHGDMLGDVMFYGKGAGSLPTASAVVSDVVAAAKHRNNHEMLIWAPEKEEIGNIDAFITGFFVRVKGAAQDAVKAAFGDVTFVDGKEGETAFLIENISEGSFKEKIAAFDLVARIRTSF